MEMTGIGGISGGLQPLFQEKKPAQTGDGFKQLMEPINRMNQQAISANSAMKKVIDGDSDNSHNALIALEQADISLRIMDSVRSKSIDGFKQISNMQI